MSTTPPVDRRATAASGEVGNVYVVAQDDTLSSIAQRLLGHARHWRALYELNRDLIGPNPNIIRPGQALRLPVARTRTALAPRAAPALPPRGTTDVVSGDGRATPRGLREPSASGALARPSAVAAPVDDDSNELPLQAGGEREGMRLDADTAAVRAVPAQQATATALARLGFDVRVDPVSGVWARGPVPGHPLPVSFFVPPSFDPNRPADLVMHLHGFLGGVEVNGVWRPFNVQQAVYNRSDFGRMLAASGRNAILIVPESVEKCRTYNAWTGASLATFLDNVATTATNAGLVQNTGAPGERFRSLVVTAHSGAYWGVAGVRHLRGPFADRLRGIALFDSNYAHGTNYRAQPHLAELGARMNARGGVFASVYRAGTNTAGPNQAMNDMLRRQHQRPPTVVTSLPGHPVPGAILSLADPDVTDGSHFRLMNRYFTPFLLTALPES